MEPKQSPESPKRAVAITLPPTDYQPCPAELREEFNMSSASTHSVAVNAATASSRPLPDTRRLRGQ